VDFNFENVPTLIVDRDHSQSSRDHVRRLLADRTLLREHLDGDVAAALGKLQVGDAAATVVLPAGLEREILAGRPAEVQVVLDGTDPNRAMVVASTAAQYFGEVTQALARQRFDARENVSTARRGSVLLPLAVKSLGMTDAFTPHVADFSGIDSGLSVGTVISKEG
jgi:ABC-2 type transport system permease protein